MKKIVIYSAFISFFFGIITTSCNFFNDDDYQAYLDQLEENRKQIQEQYETDSILIVDYLNENDSTASYHEYSGIFYNILEEGKADHPNTGSLIRVKYKGMLLDGTVFDQTPDSVSSNSFYLDNLILGWQYGIPLIGENGRIILYLPSYYGFGTTERTDVPANSVLIFDVTLIDFY